MDQPFQSNRPIREFTGDRVPVGRCWFYLKDGKTCERHGDVSSAVQRYRETGQLTNDLDDEEAEDA